MYPRCVVFGIGNESRGDDALGPLLVERLKTKIEELSLGNFLTFISDFQLQIEHTLDLQNQELALFIDAGVPPAILESEPFSFNRLSTIQARKAMSHALLPGELMGIASSYFADEQYEKESKLESNTSSHLPEAYILCIRGYEFELGAEASKKSLQNLDLAFEKLISWLAQKYPFITGDSSCTK